MTFSLEQALAEFFDNSGGGAAYGGTYVVSGPITSGDRVVPAAAVEHRKAASLMADGKPSPTRTERSL
jgi:hypothetical protein